MTWCCTKGSQSPWWWPTRPRQAQLAVETIELDMEELEPVSNVEEALRPGARLLHPDLDSYAVLPGTAPWPKGGNCGGVLTSDPGGVEEAFEEADVIVEDTYTVPRQYQAYLEPKSATASFDGWRWTLHLSHQFPFKARSRVAQALGVDESRIRVVGHHIGGGFGARLDLGIEQYAAIGASVTGRTVQLVNDRVEDLVSCMSRENATIRVRSGVTRGGRIVAREFECLMDSGAYAGDTPYLTSITLLMAGSVYRVGPTRVTAKSVYTNTAPSGAFRGVCGTYLCFALERHTDRLAQAIGMDRREFRMRNLFESGDSMLNGQTLEDADILAEAFDRVEQVAPWSKTGKGPLKGVGLAAVIWLTNPLAGSVTLGIQEDGSVGVSTAATENGSGAVTMGLRQIAAAEFGLDAQHVFVTTPDTDTQAYDAGSQGSRTTHVVGMAIGAAARQLKPRLFNIASGLLGAPPGRPGTGRRERMGARRPVPVGRPLGGGPHGAGRWWASQFNGDLQRSPPQVGPGLGGGSAVSRLPVPTYHVHLAEVEIDPDDGSVRVTRYVVAQEVGRMINPDGVYGQIQGGVAQGMGYALWEGFGEPEGSLHPPHAGVVRIAVGRRHTRCGDHRARTPVRGGSLRRERGGRTTRGARGGGDRQCRGGRHRRRHHHAPHRSRGAAVGPGQSAGGLRVRLGIDVGGTNTDAVLMAGRQVVSACKTPTTPDVSAGIGTALGRILASSKVDPLRIRAVMIGTTHFTNAVVEGRQLAATAAVRLGSPATLAVPPMADWPDRLRRALGGHAYVCRGGHEFDGAGDIPPGH